MTVGQSVVDLFVLTITDSQQIPYIVVVDGRCQTLSEPAFRGTCDRGASGSSAVGVSWSASSPIPDVPELLERLWM